MSASPVTKTQPRAGEKFRGAAGLQVEGRKARRVLWVIAAYHDAGGSPSVHEIARRIGIVAPGAASAHDRQLPRAMSTRSSGSSSVRGCCASIGSAGD